MEEIKGLFISLGGAIALTSIFKILLSESSLKKVLNIFFSSLILFYIVIPLSTISRIEIKSNDFEVNNSNSIQDGLELVVIESIELICNELDVTVINIKIDAYIEDEQLVVNELIVNINEKDKVNQVQNEIKKSLGYEVLVE